jgi:hypothetical protein
MIEYCQNCGRQHEGRLVETFTDGDGRAIEIVVCEYPRYKEVKQENTYTQREWDRTVGYGRVPEEYKRDV